LLILLEEPLPFCNKANAVADFVSGVLYTIAVYGRFPYGEEKNVEAFLLLLNPPGDVKPHAIFV
jgi:hypothetical protein